jgi:hypothetical protein
MDWSLDRLPNAYAPAGLSSKMLFELVLLVLEIVDARRRLAFAREFGQEVDRVRLSSNHVSVPFSVSGTMAVCGHPGSQTPQSQSSLACIFRFLSGIILSRSDLYLPCEKNT